MDFYLHAVGLLCTLLSLLRQLVILSGRPAGHSPMRPMLSCTLQAEALVSALLSVLTWWRASKNLLQWSSLGLVSANCKSFCRAHKAVFQALRASNQGPACLE